MTDRLLSDDIAARLRAAHGEPGAAWLRELPGLLAALVAEWELVDVGAPYPHASAALVVPVRREDGAELVLKLAPPTEWLAMEAHALAHWKGRGAVRLEAKAPARGALLLERAVPGTPLASLCAEDDRAATAAAADVMARLRATGGPAPGTLPSLAGWTDRLRPTGGGLAMPELERASAEAWALAGELAGDSRQPTVLHGDLHHHNVLRAGREPWLACDPKGLTGPPEAEPAALLRNPRRFVLSHPRPTALLADRLDVLAERLGDDVRRVAGWGYVLAVLAARWAEEGGEAEDVRKWLACAAPLREVARARGAL